MGPPQLGRRDLLLLLWQLLLYLITRIRSTSFRQKKRIHNKLWYSLRFKSPLPRPGPMRPLTRRYLLGAPSMSLPEKLDSLDFTYLL